jgi:hypothetical protein
MQFDVVEVAEAFSLSINSVRYASDATFAARTRPMI